MASLLTSENCIYGLRVGLLALSGVWYGAAQYVTTVEVPARANLPTAIGKVENFQQVFPRAKSMQGKIAGLCGIGGVAQYFLDKANSGSLYFLAAGGCMFFLWPFTLLVIMPINNQLMAGEDPKKKGDSWINKMMADWANVHLVRTIFGGIAFALNIKAILMQ